MMRLQAPAAAASSHLAAAALLPRVAGAGAGRCLWRSSYGAAAPSSVLAAVPPILNTLRAPRRSRRILTAAGKGSSKAPQEAAAAAAADDNDHNDDDDEEEADEEEDGEWDEDEDEDGEWVDEDEDDEYEDEDEEDDDDFEEPLEPLEVWEEEDFVEVGVVSRAFGVKGELRVTPLTDQPRARLGRRGVRLWLLPPRPSSSSSSGSALQPAAAAAGGRRPPLQPAVVRSGRQVRPERRGGRPGAAAWAVRLSCAPDRESAERLGGCTLLLRASDREALPGDDGEFYVQELVGMSVVLADGGDQAEQREQQQQQQTQQRLLGRVVDVLSGTGAHDTLRVRLAPSPADVRRSRYRTVLIPFCEAIVPRVSRSKGEMAVALPEGLLEATLVQQRMRRPYTDAEKETLLARLAAEGVPDDEAEERAKEEAKKKKRKGGGRGRGRPAAVGGGGE